MTWTIKDRKPCPSFSPLQEGATFLNFSWKLSLIINDNVSVLSTGNGTFNLLLLFTDRQGNGNTECLDYMRLGSKHTTDALLMLDVLSADTDFCPEAWRGRGVLGRV